MWVMASCRDSTSSTVHARHPYSTLRELASPECIGRKDASRGPGCNTTCTSTVGISSNQESLFSTVDQVCVVPTWFCFRVLTRVWKLGLLSRAEWMSRVSMALQAAG